MKSSFGRSFYMGALILLLSLTMLGASYQQLVKDYLTQSTFSQLDQDADAISHLAASYTADDENLSTELMLNLSVATSFSDSDIILCSTDGRA